MVVDGAAIEICGEPPNPLDTTFVPDVLEFGSGSTGDASRRRATRPAARTPGMQVTTQQNSL